MSVRAATDRAHGSSTRRRRSRGALVAARVAPGARARGLVVLVQLFALLLGSLHMGLVRHERCVAHGELVEVTAAARPISPLHAAHATLRAAVDDIDDTADVGRDDDHDHCTAALHPSTAPAAGGLVLEQPLVAPLPRAIVAVVFDLARTRDLLHVAPKHGPPAV